MNSSHPSKPPTSPRGTLPTLLDEESTSRELMPTRKPRDRALFTRTGGHEAGRVFTVTGAESTLGRSSGCSIQIEDASLSRVHAKIRHVGGEYVIEDCGSLNGCFVNEQRVDIARLRDGDRVQLGGSVCLRFHLVDEDELAALVRVYESSVRDGLTGVYNRRHLDERLASELAYAVRHGVGFSVVLFDVDRFKSINDTYGHATGDAVLCSAAQLIASSIRTEDMIARYGGEEFLVLARAVALPGAVMLAERIRASIERSVVSAFGSPIQITASAGVASVACCGNTPDARTLLAIADERLYKAKRAGRNRVIGAGLPACALDLARGYG